ncbi:hypothetical protein GCM10027403_36400 [Arthrobacter tecti]
MGDNTPHIDNRYSPIYQRGGTGQRPNGSTPGPASGPAGGQMPAASQQRPPSFAQAPAPSDAPKVHTPPGAQAPSGTPAPSGDQANIVEVLPEGAPRPVDRSRGTGPAILRINPFVVVLWLVGAGVMAIGLWVLFAPMQMDESSLTEPFPQWIFIVGQSAGGILMSGAIILTAAGVLSALFWERRRRRMSPASAWSAEK